jgi:hypothetical protein
MAVQNGLKGFIICTFIAVIIEFITGQLDAFLYQFMRILDVPVGSTFDNFHIIQQSGYLVNWIPIPIFICGVFWLFASIFNREPGAN